ncbi:MAG: hypothetical protein Q4C04_01290 [Clostridia bacterium]|nr:hypothetical protein [Clostridia bacterium]
MEDIIKQAKTMEETDRKCPNCGATMDYSPESGGLYCPYCEYREEIPLQGEDGEEAAQELSFKDAELRGNCDWGAEKKTVICKACGAESVYDALQISNECPYCGSNQVTEAKGVNTLAPNGVCPFLISDKQAGANFGKWIKRQLFCPSKAKKSARPDSFKGVYLPYWTFDSQTFSHYTAQYGKDRTQTNKEGDTVTVTDWYRTSGDYSRFFNDELVAASSRHDKNMLQRIEPYRTEENKAYRPEYVAGFISERYSVGLDQGWENAKVSMKRKLRSHIESHIKRVNHADKVSNLNFSTIFSGVTYKYLLLPLWLSSFRYKDKTYEFLVNGQTGKVGGKIPISPLRVAIALLLGIGFVALLIWLFSNGN